MFDHLKIGDQVPALGRKAAFYYVVALDSKRLTMERGDTGSQVKVTASKCAKVLARIEAGERVKFQGNAGANGGIDGTSAIRDGIMFVLGLERDGDFVRLKASSAAQEVA